MTRTPDIRRAKPDRRYRTRRDEPRRGRKKLTAKQWAALWKKAAKRQHHLASARAEMLRLYREEFDYLEKRVKDYPILGVLLKRARGEG